jgi:hypothetical protein
MLRSFVSAVQMQFLLWFAEVYVFVQSTWNGFKARSHPDRLHHQAPYAGQPILLVALYEKGVLRPDVRRMIATAKEQGAYVLAVNNLTLTEPADWRELLDCYIERYNYGRDFGSYQTAFLHLYAQGWEATCPRLLMLNDSVYYCGRRTPPFLADLFGSPKEALGATENFEFEHHLGSFCIAMAGSVLRHPRTKLYWQRYKKSDIRPKVIHRGEMQLSKTLKRAVSSEDQFASLYGVARYDEKVRTDPEYRARALYHSRQSDRVPWPTLKAKEVLREFRVRHFVGATFGRDEFRRYFDEKRLSVGEYVKLTRRDQPSLAAPEGIAPDVPLLDYKDLTEAATANLPDDRDQAVAMLDEMTADLLTANFVRGGHIHQNAAALVDLGLAIVKLDGMYRGVFDATDVRKICALLEPEDGAALSAILLSRPWGEHTTRGWRKAAFLLGLH